MRFIENETMIIDGMDDAFMIFFLACFVSDRTRWVELTVLLHNLVSTSPSFQFFPVDRLESRI